MNREEIVTSVCECLALVLDTDGASIRENNKLIDELGADSLDLLDLSFHLQQKFNITISPKGLEQRIQKKMEGKPYEVDGVFTPESLEELRKEMPEIPPEDLSEGLRVAELPRLFRVATMVNIVDRLLREKNN